MPEVANKKLKVDKMLKSFISIDDKSDFPLNNLPYGIFKPNKEENGRVGVALGDFVVDLTVLADMGCFNSLGFDTNCFNQDALNQFMGLDKKCWLGTREVLLKVLSENESMLRDNEEKRKAAFFDRNKVIMLLPAKIGDYTDFYASANHALNVGKMFRNADKLNPNWLSLPVGYHGRSSSVVLSGTPLKRPQGQLQNDIKDPTKGASFGVCKRLDFEMEMGCFIGGKANKLGESIPMTEADDHVFGFVLLNDWSARDIQKWEYVPLGPFGAKNFGTSISPWVVTPEALEPFRCKTSSGGQDPAPLPYLVEPNHSTYDVELTISLKNKEIGPETFQLSKTNYRHMYWTHRQQLVHHTVTGCDLNPGDLLGSGTISGTEPSEYGSLLELSWSGKNPVKISETVERKFLEDGDSVIMTGQCQGDGFCIGFGECEGTILPANPSKY